ncbi:hypothetical protein BBP18_09960 [Bacillus velezensis]|uniref:YonK family protein n=1 Tax=Bacillus subtilis TaxID=1423 RepID=A0A3A5I5X2_BACIU|nr:hypothetical protein AAV29_10945 [Bacillus velezensis]AMR46824.1 hypothetical protein KHRBS_10320 [Bacillus subtilis subsp. subtilis]EHA30581.1 hypothetical protein BSSC8_21660 [Bacillus subtilis subsp. subtilis str. SC-8]KUP30277.1 hypothetical protein AU385_17850 [Bacillus halotolerans]MBE1868572.1 YonK family protein [Bacillus subtilis]MBL3637575.1 YonK family protein [Alkalicoccobacillus gibsonii]MBU8885915.1 YonK family protein [Bacillus sp. FJAT-27001]NMJ93038.1 YonK family protein 
MEEFNLAKKVHTVNLKGNYTYIDGIIEEETKTDIERYDLNSILKSFDGRKVKISITEEDELPQINE